MPEQFVQGILGNGKFKTLNRYAVQSAPLVLYLLIRNRHQFYDLHPAGTSRALPEFCRIFRATPDGERRCLECRSRVAVSAYGRGLSEYRCHGGIAVVAAPAIRSDGRTSDRLVVASCLAARHAHARGWRAAACHASGLGIDVQRLKAAYYALPTFSDAQLSVVKTVVDLAATMLGGMEERLLCADHSENLPPGRESTHRDAQEQFTTWFLQTKGRSVRPAEIASGSALVDLIVATVKRSPSTPHTIAHFARAACVTANHVSATFHKHTGKTFREFLRDERMECACRLLGDPRLSVSEAALECGFDDPAYFSRWFRHATGQSPTEWRNGTERVSD